MRLLIAVAHADDETLGCSTIIGEAPESVHILHATDSAPRDLQFALRAGFSTREAYAAARREELRAMLKEAGVGEERYHCLNIADQEVPIHWRRVREYVEAFGADRIYTHAYEGGHPDHDAVALALSGLPNVWEFPLYHGFGGEFVPHTFLSGEAEDARNLDEVARKRKQRWLACFDSQKPIIEKFPVERELFRRAMAYDFTKPPHEGPLYYEVRKLGWTWPEWRQATAAAR